MLSIALLVVLGVVVVLSRILKRQENGPQPPMYPGALPVIGHGHLLLGSKVAMWQVLKDVSNYSLKMGGMVKGHILGKPLYIITDPDDSMTVANTCLDKFFMYDFFKPWVGNGIFSSDVALWKKSRKLFNPAFSSGILNKFLDSFNRQSRRLVDQLAVEAGKGKFDTIPYVFKHIFEAVHETIVGFKPEDNKLITDDYILDVDELFDSVVDRAQRVWLYWSFLYNRSSLKNRQDKLINKSRETILTVLQKRKTEFLERKKQGADYSSEKVKTILDFIFENYVDNEGFTDDGIREHMDTFIVASLDTTSTTIVFLLKLIGSHPEIQENIYNEIRDVFGESDRDVDKADISKLTYLQAVIKESVRLYPVAPVVGRVALNDVKLKNYTIPRGSDLIISLYGLNRHPTWGEDAEQFRPERWLDTARPGALFAGFSLGRRNCIGAAYAMKLISTNMVHIIRRYRISTEDCEEVTKFFLKPIAGHRISIEIRT